MQQPNDVLGRQPPAWYTGEKVRWCVWLVHQLRAKLLWVEHVNVKMHRQLRDAFADDPLQYGRRTCGQCVRSRVTETKRADDVVLDCHPSVQTRIHDSCGLKRCVDFAHQLWVSSAEQGVQNHGVALSKVFGREHIGMGIEPQDAEKTLLANPS